MKVSKKDYDEFALLWSVFEYMTGTFVNADSTLVEGYMTNYGLKSDVALFVAKKEGIDLKGYA